MASSLRNISALLSPRFRSPLTPTKNILGTPKSDGKLYCQHINRPNVSKKLDFLENTKHTSKFAIDVKKTTNNILPDIKIENVPGEEPKESNNLGELHFSITGGRTLDINTPNKLELVKHGLDNFKSTRILGKGTFGTVFWGKQKGKAIAVKIVSKENSLREENALHLNHENIVRTLEVIRNLDHQNYCLIIMEYLPNCKNLQDVLENFNGESSNSLFKYYRGSRKKFCLDITTGLDYCHNGGVLHLDLKPKNVLVDSENVCKICDFGNSAKIEENLESFKHNGTIAYTAPEILLGKQPTTKSDIYSLGLIFWQIKYRKNPFQRYENNESIIYNVGKYNVKPIYEDKNPDILTQIFTKCWQSDSELRPSTAEILKDLKNVEF